jgi:hypothetical protein
MITGHCLCGDVSYGVDGPVADVLHCHCEPCRRATGNFVAAARAERADITITGEEHVRWHDLGFSRYGFCGNCGSHMFWVAADRPALWSLQMGCIDKAEGLELAGVWFADDAQPHNVLPSDVPHFAGNDEGFR